MSCYYNYVFYYRHDHQMSYPVVSLITRYWNPKGELVFPDNPIEINVDQTETYDYVSDTVLTHYPINFLLFYQ